MFSRAYWWNERNRAKATARYVQPETIEEEIKPAGLVGFWRTANGVRQFIPADRLTTSGGLTRGWNLVRRYQAPCLRQLHRPA